MARLTPLLLQVSLIRDTSTLGTLREMLVLIRLLGQTTPAVLPSITPSAGKLVSPSDEGGRCLSVVILTRHSSVLLFN